MMHSLRALPQIVGKAQAIFTAKERHQDVGGNSSQARYSSNP
jgi:hypothetical protein